MGESLLVSTRAASPVVELEGEPEADEAIVSQAQPQLEQLLLNHIRFARAFKKNDTALIVPFLARDVRMRTMDGGELQGQPAVLAHLVGARMAKLSANLHVKGCPSRTGAWQSSFVYEHGMLFKDPLYIEVLDWESPTVVRAIAHVPLPDAKGNKSFQEFLRAKPRMRCSFGDSHSRRSVAGDASDDDSSRSSSLDDDHDSDFADSRRSEFDLSSSARGRASQPEEEASSPQRDSFVRRSICTSKAAAVLETMKSIEAASAASQAVGTRQRVASGDTISTSSQETAAPTSPFDDDALVYVLAELSVTTELTPIRKRKHVNPFVVLHSVSTGAVWKSPILKRVRSPRWNRIPITLPIRSSDDILEVTLWDQAFIRSTKIASAKFAVSQLLKGDAAYLANVELERLEYADKNMSVQSTEEPTIPIQLDFRRRLKVDRNNMTLFETHIGSGSEDEGEFLSGKSLSRQSSGSSTDIQTSTQGSLSLYCSFDDMSVAGLLTRFVLITLIAWAAFYYQMYVRGRGEQL